MKGEPPRAEELWAGFLSHPGAWKRASPAPRTPGSAGEQGAVERSPCAVGAVSPFHGLLTCPRAGDCGGTAKVALRHPHPLSESKRPHPPGGSSPRKVLPTKFLVVGHLLRRGRSGPTAAGGMGREVLPVQGAAQLRRPSVSSSGQPGWSRKLRTGRASPGSALARLRQALPHSPSTPGRTATSPARAISSPCQHVRIPGARSPARTSPSLAVSFACPAPPQEFARP